MAKILAANQITIAKVLDGEKGIQGERGADGKSSYFHIKYSSVANPTSSSEMSETPLAYIGTYVDFTEADSIDPTKYTWSRFEGIQGEKGEQGIPGIGTDGKTSYLHIAYATSADGSEGFSISESANKTYIGQYTDFVSTDSTDYTKYAWTKIKGEMSAEQLAQLNQASEDASQAKSDVKNLEIGGRNYVVKTDSFSLTKNGITVDYDGDVYHVYGTNTKTDANYIAGPFANRPNIFEPGAIYTVSTTTPLPSGLYLGVNTQKSDGTAINAGVGNSNLYGDGVKTSNTFICRTNSNGTLSGFFGISSTCGTIDVTFKIKLEKGNKATDWTPAPEDVDEGIKNAAKTATNYIHSDTTNGLVVNNNQNVGVGYDIQLKADGSNTGMNIRQDGEILASFLQNQVSLGKNSINSRVGMCGDKGSVSASFGYYIDSVTSINGEPGSTLSFDFNETAFKNKVGQTTGFYEFIYTSADGWELFDPVHDTTSKVTLSQYGITMKTPTSSLNDYAQITIKYVLDGSVKFYNADISNPVRKLELEMAENPSSSESDFANITIERQSGTYANGDGKEHSIITMMTLHEFANVATLQLFDDSISLDAAHLYLNSSHGEGSIELNGDTYINGIPIQGCHKIATSSTGAAGSYTYGAINKYMVANHTVYLEEKISEQQNGIILVWSFYENSAWDWGWNFTVIPKRFVVDNAGGGGMSTFMSETATFGNVGAKYIQVRDDRIIGSDSNFASGTGTSGIKYNNNKFVLRWVYGF